MKNKELFINLGISAGAYLAWLLSTLFLLSIDNIEEIGFVITWPVLIAGCVYIVYRSGKILLYPVTVLVIHTLVCVIAIVGVMFDIDSVFSDSTSEGFEALLDLFLMLGGVFLVVVMIIVAAVTMVAIFLLTLLTAFLSKKYFDKKRLEAQNT